MPNLTLPKGAGVQERIELLALANPDELAAAAALLNMTEAEALAFIEQHDAAISAERLRLHLGGGTMDIQARRLVVRALDRFNVDFDQLDTMEVADLLKHALRIIENEDRKELAKRDPFAGLPVTNIRINLIHATKPATKAVQVDTVDVQAVEVRQ